MNASALRAPYGVRAASWLGLAAVTLLGALLIGGSQSLLFADTNDFRRVAGHLGLTPLGDGIRWALPDGPFRQPANPELATPLFSLAAKCLLLACALVLLRLAEFALPHHFTAHYFPVYPHYPYLKRLDDGARPVTTLLTRMTAARDRFVTPLAPVLLLGGLGFFALSRRAGEGLRRLAVGGLILSLFIATQVVVALLGEGVRDLSKHLWGAQLALDLLLVLIVLQAIGWLPWRRGAWPAADAANAVAQG